MDDVDESALVARCRAGDDEAFRTLVVRYKNLVFGVAVRMAPSPADAEDFAQDVFLRVHRGLPYFRGEARLSTWIYRIILNVCSEHRSRVRTGMVSLDADDSGRLARRAALNDPAFTQVETRDRLQKAMAQLDAPARLLVAAHYLDGVKYEDLAEALGLPLGTVKTNLFRAKRRLRHILQETDAREM